MCDVISIKACQGMSEQLSAQLINVSNTSHPSAFHYIIELHSLPFSTFLYHLLHHIHIKFYHHLLVVFHTHNYSNISLLYAELNDLMTASAEWPERKYCSDTESFFLCKLWEGFGSRKLGRMVRSCYCFTLNIKL